MTCAEQPTFQNARFSWQKFYLAHFALIVQSCYLSLQGRVVKVTNLKTKALNVHKRIPFITDLEVQLTLTVTGKLF